MARYVNVSMTATQAGQAVKALLLLGEEKITVTQTEKGRFTVATSETSRK